MHLLVDEVILRSEGMYHLAVLQPIFLKLPREFTILNDEIDKGISQCVFLIHMTPIE